MFSGANINAGSVTERYGIGKENAVRYHSDKRGIELNFKVMSNVHVLRMNKKIDKNWSNSIKTDYNARKKGN